MTDWARRDSHGSNDPHTWARRLKHLRSFTRWLQQFEPRTEVPDNTILSAAFPSARPGVRDMQALWPERLEDEPPRIACQMLVYFDIRADVDRMLASAERQALRPRALALKAMFDGAISHIDYRVGPT